MTSCARRWISGLPRCTEAKSRSALDAPLFTDDAAPPPSPMSIAGPPSTTIFVPDRDLAFLDVIAAHVAEAAGDHDGLVITAHAATGIPMRRLLEGPEIAADVRPAEFIVERGAADRAVDHDVERRDDAIGFAQRRTRRLLPRLLETRECADARRRTP